jgi:aminoacrylate hydrolase
MPIADIPGGSLRYEIHGRGLEGDSAPLVLLLPQSTGPVGLNGLIDGLVQHHTVIAYNQRGTGCSTAAPDPMSIATQAADVVGLLDALDIGKATLLCHSTGCGMGLLIAAEYPDRVATLILVAPWTYADPHLTSMQNLRIAAARALDPKQYARFNAALLFPPDFRRAHQEGFERLATDALAKPQDADEIERRLGAILALDVRPHLRAIAIRTLAIVATDDQLMPTWFAADVARSMPNAELIELHGGGHMLLETRSSQMVEIVLAFLHESRAV